jgi:acyl carrier protein
LYKSGDLARCLSDFDLEYLGRIDNQVQIRGFRVELGEIEAVLGSHEAVRQVSAMVWKDAAGNDRLVAYIIPYEKQHPCASVLRNYMMKNLPEYMIPNAFVFLEKFPLTPNGKLDRRSLPSPGGTRPESELAYVAPGTEMERKIASIWQEVLHLEKVGIHDNFFELGGHSLLATQVVSRIREILHLEVPLKRFFESPSIASLSIEVEEILLKEIEELSEDEAQRIV